jgi:hypothetical protein
LLDRLQENEIGNLIHPASCEGLCVQIMQRQTLGLSRPCALAGFAACFFNFWAVLFAAGEKSLDFFATRMYIFDEIHCIRPLLLEDRTFLGLVVYLGLGQKNIGMVTVFKFCAPFWRTFGNDPKKKLARQSSSFFNPPRCNTETTLWIMKT